MPFVTKFHAAQLHLTQL